MTSICPGPNPQGVREAPSKSLIYPRSTAFIGVLFAVLMRVTYVPVTGRGW